MKDKDVIKCNYEQGNSISGIHIVEKCDKPNEYKVFLIDDKGIKIGKKGNNGEMEPITVIFHEKAKVNQ